MRQYLLSLIIPTFNCAAFLDETLTSVLTQLPDNYELVVIDDGSDEDTRRCLKSYEGRKDNLRIICRPHGGVSHARNAGLDAASGEYVAFMDCDDRLKPDFFGKSLPLLTAGRDLTIFSFDRVESDGRVIPLTVNDRIYEDVSALADDYIRTRQMLIYSASNKFYRKSLLDRNGLRFREGMSFGEDRLFNYEYLRHCGSAATSSVKMFDYMQRNPDSASRRTFPNYFDTLIMLHEAKADCFCSLSRGTTLREKTAFIGHDISVEIGRMLDRFEDFPEEKAENLPKINRLLFGEPQEAKGPFDYIIVLGSPNCGYKAARALEIAGSDPGTVFVVSGGNPHLDGQHSEAGFMADYLRSQGIPGDRIIVEGRATNTWRNLEFSSALIDEHVRAGYAAPRRICVVTAGFHIPRTIDMALQQP